MPSSQMQAFSLFHPVSQGVKSVKRECSNSLHTNTLSFPFPFHPPARVFLYVFARVYETPGVKGEKVNRWKAFAE